MESPMAMVMLTKPISAYFQASPYYNAGISK